MDPKQVLATYWGYQSFRSPQDHIINSVVNGRDTLALLPTGGGKSICFQVPALMMPGLTIVISPLVSLMKDQVDALLSHQIAATYLASSLTKQESASRLNSLMSGHYKLVYVAPERLISQKFLAVILKQKISQLVVDEAHCISEWGHTFRPNYRLINKFMERIPHRPIITAVTATATPQTIDDIIRQLKMKQPAVFKKSFKRNINIAMINCQSTAEQEIHLLRLIKKHHHQAGIIYCATRRQTELLCQQLQHSPVIAGQEKIGYYHGGMTAQDRSAIQQKFLDDKVQLLCATNAFGMGIDKPNVSFVIHYQIPSSIEQYYQEIGRAGRSGQNAAAYLLFNPNQVAINYQLINETKDCQQRKRQTLKLKKLLKLATSKKCITRSILAYFGETTHNCGQCDRCRRLPHLPPTLRTMDNDQEKIFLKKLLQYREFVAKQQRLDPCTILTDSQAQYLALYRPTNVTHLKQIRGVGQGWIDCYGSELINANWYQKLCR